MVAPINVINLKQKFSLFSEHWRPKIIASVNGQEVRIVKCKGEFVWHSHAEEDEFFLVWRGSLDVEFRDGTVTLSEGEAIVIPREVEHRTVARAEVEMLIFEPASTTNTGNVEVSALTAPKGVRI